MMRRRMIAIGLVGLLSLGVAGDRWPGGGGGAAGIPEGTEFVTREWFGNNAATASFTSNHVLGQFGTFSPAAFAGATEHFTHSIGSSTAGQTITLLRMTCSITDITSGSGTATVRLVVFEDGGDTTAESLGSITFNLATEGELIKELTTFSAITSTAPYYFGVQLADGGTVSVTNCDVMCQTVWTRE